MVAHVFNPSTQEAEAFEDTLVYTAISIPDRVANETVSQKK